MEWLHEFFSKLYNFQELRKGLEEKGIDKKGIKYHSATFVKVDTIPDSDCWLKKRKWSWEK